MSRHEEQATLQQMSRFRQKVIQMVIYEKKSVYETAMRCGCTADKVKRVLKKWKMISKMSHQK